MRNISKSFPGVKAIDKININLAVGEVHMLIGENGAGKSTLMKILSGAFPADSGDIFFEGNKAAIETPKVAENLGIKMVYQEPNMIPYISVYNNIFLGNELKRRKIFLNKEEMRERSREIFKELKVNIDPDTLMINLGIGSQQLVEIAKALSFNAKILIFDEPTSSLSSREIEQLFEIIKYLREKGVGIFYISHILEEAFKIADKVSILRDGQLLSTSPISEITIEGMIKQIAGRSITEFYPHKKKERGKKLIEVKGLSSDKFEDVNITVYEGEIVGLSGLVGAGRTELARAIFGIDKYDEGNIYLGGNKLPPNNPKKSVDMRLSLIPEDRKTEGLALILDVKKNISLASLKFLFPNNIINNKKEQEVVWSKVKDLSIATLNLEKQVMYLSGGNQQKVVIAKWLLKKANVFIFDEPTRGIDVGAKVEVYKLMEELLKGGAGILMISSVLSEIMGMSDRIYVMSKGKIVGELDAAEANQKDVLNLAFGQQKGSEIQ